LSRASWYRHGKPDEKPRRPSTNAQEAARGGMSLRSYQRFLRVMGDEDVAPYLVHGALKLGQAEQLLTNPKLKRRFLQWAARQSRKGSDT
jgi:hypothetical protein